MVLKFNGAWRFDSPGEIPVGVVNDFFDLIVRIASQSERRQSVLEHFKSYFANASGAATGWSSSESWAETDLDRYMRNAADNAPLFIEAFYDACETLHASHPDFAMPDIGRMNRVLSENGANYEIRPPDLVNRNPQVAIAGPERVASLDEQAQELIQKSFAESEKLLAEGRDRPAVQEILWLLETVSTAFQGMGTEAGTVQGKYFNKIAKDLRRQHKGKTLEMVLDWTTALHGYLSSPTGGGIRHGANLNAGIALRPNEARLFCNLIRSYISFLIAEHERLSRTPTN